MSNKTGIELIAQERKRQIEKEGWTSQHDDEHTEGQLAEAAAYYCLTPAQRIWSDTALAHTNGGRGSSVWPWEPEWFKPTPHDRIRELVKAGGLIAAEIDREIRRLEKLKEVLK